MQEIINKLISSVKKFPKQLYISIAIGCIGLILFGYGILTSLTPKKSDNAVFADQTSLSSPTIPTVKTVKRLFIDVEGGLEKPGVYQLDENTRVQDALIAAGGLSASADRNWVEKNLNLAAKINDGSKIYIPRSEETSTLVNPAADNDIPNNPNTSTIPTIHTKSSKKNSFLPFSPYNPSNSSDILGVRSSTTVNINTANAEELHSIKGIGKKTAEKIINGRPYTDIQDLLTRKIVRKSTFQKIKDKISAY